MSEKVTQIEKDVDDATEIVSECIKSECEICKVDLLLIRIADATAVARAAGKLAAENEHAAFRREAVELVRAMNIFLGWGDCSLENLHNKATAFLAKYGEK